MGSPCSSEAESLGKLVMDDNAADARAGAREPGMIRAEGPKVKVPATATEGDRQP